LYKSTVSAKKTFFMSSINFIKKTGQKFGLDFRNVTDNGDTLSFRHNTNTYTVKKNAIKTHMLQMLSEYYSKLNWTRKLFMIDHAVPNLAPYCLILIHLCINPLKKKHRPSFQKIANLKYDGFIVEDDMSTLDICNYFLMSNVSVAATLRLLNNSDTLLEFVDRLHTSVTGKDLLVVYDVAEPVNTEETPNSAVPPPPDASSPKKVAALSIKEDGIQSPKRVAKRGSMNPPLYASIKYGFGVSSEAPDMHADLLIDALRRVEDVPHGYPMFQTSVYVFGENNECIGESTLEKIIAYKRLHQEYLSLVATFVQ